MPEKGQDVTIVDGSLDFSGGANSYLVPTVRSEANPNGIPRTQLSWMNNCTVRGGGITQRPAWKRLGALPAGMTGLYQGGWLYEPDADRPYLILAIDGNIWQVDPDNAAAATNLSAAFGLSLSATESKFFFCQAEQFLVIQAGDLFTLPLFWDGRTLRRSLGLSGLGLNYQPPGTVVGHIIFRDNYVIPAFWTMPAAVGGVVVVNTSDTSLVVGGSHVFMLNGYSYNPATNEVLSYNSITASFLVGAIVPNTSVQLTLLGATPAVLGTNFAGQSFSSLVQEPVVFTPGTPEIPPATAMDYFMGRLWYAQGRQYSAGDIVGNQSSGTQAYNFRDSVVKVTENPLAVGGDGFRVPDDSGNIRAIRHAANINTQLGEGRLYIFTRSTVYSLTVPVSRTDWIGADNNNLPRQEVVQLTNGAVSDRSIVEQNGDLFFQSLEPSIRSLIVAIRDFSQWGNTPISINENRILKFNNRGLMQFSSGISFNNRLLQLVLPEQSPVGVIHRAVIPLNFDVVSTLENKLPPTWEGMWQGQAILELVGGDFLGLERCFMPVWSENQRQIELWEMTDAEQFEGDDNRVLWYVEFPAYTWGDEFKQKKLIGGELWFDRIFGEVLFSMDWRPDSSSCWYKWAEWKFCTARNSCEDVHNPECLYPKEYCETYRQMMNLPLPPVYCEPQMSRPANIGYQFQCRLTIKGFCRIRGIMLKAQEVESQTFGRDMIC